MNKPPSLSTRIPVTKSATPSFSNRNTRIGSNNDGAVIFVPPCACSLMWILVQVEADTTLQLMENGQPITSELDVTSGTVIQFAGRYLPNNSGAISFKNSAGATVNYELAWVTEFRPDLIAHETEVFFNPATGAGGHSLSNIFDSHGNDIDSDGAGALLTDIQDSSGQPLGSSNGGLWANLRDALGNVFGVVGNAIFSKLVGPSGNVADVTAGSRLQVEGIAGGRQPRILQKANGVSAAASFTVAFPNDVKQGSTIVVCAAVDSSGAIAFGVADTLKNQFVMQANGAANIGLGIFYAPVASAGGADSITVSLNTPLAMGVEIYEVEGVGEMDGTFSSATVGATSLILATNVYEENTIAFCCVGAGAGVISAQAPALPISSQFDSGNLPVAGANLKNFGSFSALMGAPIGSTSTTFSPNTNNSFAINLGASVAARMLVVTFKPVAMQVKGIVMAQGLGATDTTAYPMPVSNGGVTVVIASQGGGQDGILNTSLAFLRQVTTALMLTIAPHLFNGTSWDRQRGNTNGTTGDTGAKAASFTGAIQTNTNNVGAFITIVLGVVSGTTPTLSAQLQYSPDGTGTTWLNIGPALPNLTASNQTGLLAIFPANFSQAAGAAPANLTSGATQAIFLNSPLPRTWRINYTIAGTTPSFAITNVFVQYIGN